MDVREKHLAAAALAAGIVTAIVVKGSSSRTGSTERVRN